MEANNDPNNDPNNGDKNIKRQLLYSVLSAVACVLIWKAAPALSSRFVTRAAPASVNQLAGPEVPPGAVLVNISMVGFDPATIEAKAGEPLKLAFYRPNANNCAREVIFPDLGIEKQLPPGETTVVDVTPRKAGELLFQCGMKMLKGKLIVR